jgi:hypothetical protein
VIFVPYGDPQALASVVDGTVAGGSRAGADPG